MRADVAADELQQRGGQRDSQTNPQRCARKIQMPFLQQMPRADADDEKSARLPRAAQRVEQPVHRGRIEHQLPEIRDFRARFQAFADNVIAGRRLHPGIGDDDPDGTEMRAEADHARREKMQFASDPVPAEQQHREKAGFEEEREDAFRRQRAAKHVADETRIGRPVRAELEFHDDARGHADGEREREHLGPEPRHLVINGFLRLEPEPFHDHEQNAQPDAQWRVNVVKRNRRSELDAG